MKSKKQGPTKSKQHPSTDKLPAPTKKTPKVDHRKQLYNEGQCGPIEHIQLPAEMITCLRGILFDLDPDTFRGTAIAPKTRANPEKFYRRLVRPWLRRHPVFDNAEVRCSGRGLHVIIWFDEPVEFATDGDRQRWAGIVRALQAVLPSDPDAPGITATTRALGSLNSKNGTKVTRLQSGKPVPAQAVLDLFHQLRASPFRTVMQILFGTERVRPCPICSAEGSTLAAMDGVGICYGSCGKVPLSRLYDHFLDSRPSDSGK